jgi:hypothetical protein
VQASQRACSQSNATVSLATSEATGDGVNAVENSCWRRVDRTTATFELGVGAGLVMALVAIAASWLPARQAARVDPVIAMRAD